VTYVFKLNIKMNCGSKKVKANDKTKRKPGNA